MSEDRITLEDITRVAVAMSGMNPVEWAAASKETRDAFLEGAINEIFTAEEQQQIIDGVMGKKRR